MVAVGHWPSLSGDGNVQGLAVVRASYTRVCKIPSTVCVSFFIAVTKCLTIAT